MLLVTIVGIFLGLNVKVRASEENSDNYRVYLQAVTHGGLS
jgi:hypothetical protein